MTFKNYIFKNLWLQVVLSLIIGLCVGLILGDDVGVGIDDYTLDSLSSYLKIPANIFLSIIQEGRCRQIVINNNVRGLDAFFAFNRD